MTRTRSLLSGSLLLLALSVLACSSSDITVPATTGALEITTATTGAEPDQDGYTVQVDGGAAQPIAPSASLQNSEVAPGDHTVQLGGMAANCGVGGANPQTVSVVAGETARVTFSVTCAASSGGVQITISSSGVTTDPDGFTVSVDGTDRGTLAANGTVNVGGLTAGAHLVGLGGMAANCQVAGDNPQTVTIIAGQNASAGFSVTCSPPPASGGSLRIKTATTGPDPDADGYAFAVDGGATQPVGVNATATLANVSVGSHSVKLSGMAQNCSAQGANPRPVSVAAGATAEVSFAVTCSPTGGMQWTSISLPSDGSGQFKGSSIWASSATDIFVAGQYPGATDGSILHYDGQAWSESFGGASLIPVAVWGLSATDVFATGVTSAGGISPAPVLHYNGAEWSDIGPKNEFDHYLSIWGTSSHEVFVGGWYDAIPEVGLLRHYDGTTWSSMDAGFGTYGRVTDLAGSSPLDVFAAGQDTPYDDPQAATTYSVAHYDGSRWTESFATQDFSLNGVWANARNDAFIVAAGGRIFHYDGSMWSPMTSPTTQDLADLWGNSRSNVYAVGVDGILHYDGTGWSVVHQTPGKRVWGTATDVFVLGQTSVVHGAP